MPSFKNRSIDFLWKSNDKVLLGGKFNFKQAKKKKAECLQREELKHFYQT